MVTRQPTKLGKLIREAREAKNLTQENVAAALGLRRPISVTKWELGDAPVPVHHYLPLSKVLGIPWERFLEAARDESAELVDLIKHLTAKPESGRDLWEKLRRQLDPATQHAIDDLLSKYSRVDPLRMVSAALRYYAQRAQYGLDANLLPITLAPQLRGRSAKQSSARAKLRS